MAWALTYSGTNIYTGPNPDPTISFQITRDDDVLDTEMVEGVALWFRVSNVVGAKGWDNEDIASLTSTARAYDPVVHMTEAYWDFGQPGYVPLVTTNTPVQFRDLNKDEGHLVHQVMRAGTPTVTCLLFDTQGNWGTATYTFGSGGDAPEIHDADTYFAGDKTLCFSPDGNFTGKPTGASEATTRTQINSWATSKQGTGLVRLLLRRGETYNMSDIGGEVRTYVDGLFVDAYGTGEMPIINHGLNSQHGKGGFFQLSFATRPCLIANIDNRGRWDATTETGIDDAIFWDGNGMRCRTLTLYRCKFSGLDRVEWVRDGGEPARYRSAFDCEVTSWKTWGLNTGTRYNGLKGNKIHQHEDALGGLINGNGRNDDVRMGNLHGCWRHTGRGKYSHIRANSFFNNAGWSASQSLSWTTTAPTVEQNCIRFNTGSDVTAFLDHHNWTCNYFEGGAEHIQLKANEGGLDNGTNNMVFSKNIFVATAMTGSVGFCNYMGVTFRNCYFIMTAIPMRGWDANPTFNLVNDNCTIYNCTVINLRPEGLEVQAPYVTSGTGGRQAHNVHYRPNSSPAVGTDLLPFSTGVFNGVTLLRKGQRWGFPPIGCTEGTSLDASFAGPITVGSVRELGPGNVANNEWIALDYPDYTGYCRGSNVDGPLGQVTRAICEGNSTQFHQLSIVGLDGDGNKSMSPLAAGGTGQIVVEFTDTKIRVQNTSGLTWPSTGAVWFKPDLSDYLMAPRADTGHAGQTLPAYAPQSGSAAWISDWSGPFARKDILGTIRPDGLNDSGVAQTGQRAAGALAAA